MIIVEYDTRNCPFCNEAILGKWRANCSLPIGEKITTVDRFSSDPRNKILTKLEEKFGGAYILPVYLILDKKSSSIVLSVLDSHHTKTFFKELNNIL
jgi:hypothetical protein